MRLHGLILSPPRGVERTSIRARKFRDRWEKNIFGNSDLNEKRADRSSPATTESERSGIRTIKSLSRGLVASLIGILLCIAIIIAVVYFSAARLDVYANEKSVAQIQRLLDLEFDKLADLSLEYGWWNEAVEMVVYEKDLEWAESNVGGYLQDRYNIDTVLSIDRDGELAYGKQGDEILQAVPAELMTPILNGLIKEAVKTDFSDPQPVSGIISIKGVPALVAVTTFAVYAPTEREIDRSHGALILIKMLNEELLSTWSENFQIEGLSLVPVGLPAGTAPRSKTDSLALSLSDDPSLSKLQWTPDHAGDRFLAMILPWALGAGLLIILASTVFYLKLRHYGRIALDHFTDLVSSRKVLLRQAQYDFLTGLVNRSLFQDIVMREMHRCIRHQEQAAVVYIDLDGFKVVNDTLGHDAGDELLCRVAADFKDSVRQEDTVARFGGDEFCLLLTNIPDPGDVERVLSKIHDKFSDPLSIRGREVFIGASAGVVMIPDDTTDCSSVFRFSDIAMYAAKAKGENGYCLRIPDQGCH